MNTGKNMSDIEENPEENNVEPEKTPIGVTNPFPSSYIHEGEELPKRLGGKWKGWLFTHYRRIILAFIITLVLITCVVGFEALFNMFETNRNNIISRWPTVSGTVISSEVLTVGTERTHELRLWFTYTVEGVTYQDSQRWPVFKPEEEVQYPPGAVVTIHYDPAKPGNALINLSEGMSLWTWLGIILIIFAFIGFIYTWGWWVRDR